MSLALTPRTKQSFLIVPGLFWQYHCCPHRRVAGKQAKPQQSLCNVPDHKVVLSKRLKRLPTNANIHLFIPEHHQNSWLNTIQAWIFLLLGYIKFICTFTIFCIFINFYVIQSIDGLPLNLLRFQQWNSTLLNGKQFRNATHAISAAAKKSLPRLKKRLDRLMEEKSVTGY